MYISSYFEQGESQRKKRVPFLIPNHCTKQFHWFQLNFHQEKASMS